MPFKKYFDEIFGNWQKNNERLVENFDEIFEKISWKILGKCWENLGKILSESMNFLNKFRSNYQNTLRKTEEAFDFIKVFVFLENLKAGPHLNILV